MNVLILTPDGVGSTILQRIVTLALHLNNQDVINCHELTNGLIKKDNKIHKDFSKQYSQSLETIATLLQKSTGSLVSRLAKYHLDARNDNLASQTNFFKFLKSFNNKILVCKRKNIFEYALSWSIRNESKVLNVYKRKQKAQVNQVSKIDEKIFLQHCKNYVTYLNWIENNFKDYDVVNYEDFVLDPDSEIERLFGIEKVFSKTFGANLSEIFKKEYLVFNNKVEIENKLDVEPLLKYKSKMNTLQRQSVLPIGISAPVKNTALEDKKNMLENFDNCKSIFLDFARRYNWIDASSIDYDFWNKKML